MSINLKTAIQITLFTLAGLFASQAKAKTEILTVAGGCFWCVESDFETVTGVSEVVSGYTGGMVKNPTYRQVVSGKTGHYEAVQILFNPEEVSRKKLLALFMRSIDPTDAGGQFCDRGYSYSTAIFIANDDEKKLAETVKEEAAAELGQELVTPILPEAEFYTAEAYHQDYYKDKSLVLTRFGPLSKADAYKRYRKACGRDARILELWGSEAPFAKTH